MGNGEGMSGRFSEFLFGGPLVRYAGWTPDRRDISRAEERGRFSRILHVADALHLGI